MFFNVISQKNPITNRMFGLIDSSLPHGQASINSSLPYLQSEQIDISIGHGIASIKVIQNYLNFNDKEHGNVEFYFPLTNNIILQSFVAQLEKSRRTAESSLTTNSSDSLQCKEEDCRIQHSKSETNSVTDGFKEWVRFKIPVVQAQESICITLVYLQKLELSRNGFYSLQLPQSNSTASYPINTKIHFEERQTQDSIIYHSVNHQLEEFQPPILLDNENSQGLQPLYLRSNYSHSNDKPFIINFFNRDNKNASSVFLQSSKVFSDCDQKNQDHNYSLITLTPSMLLGSNCTDKLAEQIKQVPNKQDTCCESISDCIKLNHSRSEFIVILDSSGAMSGSQFSQAIEGIVLFLKSLPVNCHFNVISQGSGTKYESLFDHSVGYSQENLVGALNRVRHFQTNLGSQFNLLNALKSIDSQPAIPQFARQIIVISDPIELENSSEEIEQFFKNQSVFCPIHTVNANSHSDSLIFKQISNHTGGTLICKQNTQNQSLLDQILSLIPLTLQPTLSDIQVSLDDDCKLVTQIIPDQKQLQSVQFNEQVSILVAYKSDPSSLNSIPATLKYFNSVSSKVEEHKIDLLQQQKEGAAHLSKDFKKSLFKFCVSEQVHHNNNQCKDLALVYQIHVCNQTFFQTKCFQLSETGDDKKSLSDTPKLNSTIEKHYSDDPNSSQSERTRSVSSNQNVNLMSLYDHPPSNQGDLNSQDQQKNKKSQDINDLIDAIFMGEPQKPAETQQHQDQDKSQKSGSINSQGQKTDLLDLDDDNQIPTSSQASTQMSVASNIAQMGDPNSEQNDDILEFIQTQPQNPTKKNQESSNANADDLLDDLMIGNSPSQGNHKHATLIEILDNINYDGLFNANKLILHSILHANSDKFISEKPQNLSLEQWSTLLVIAELKKNLSNDKKKWNFIVKKGILSLQSVLKENEFETAIEKSSSFLK